MRFSILLLFVGVSVVGLHPTYAEEVATDFETAYRWYTERLSEGDNENALLHSQTAYELGLEKFGGDSANVAILAYNYSRLLSLSKNRKEAAAIATVAREIAERAHGEVSSQVFDLLQWEGKTHLVISEYDIVTEVAGRLIDMAIDLYGKVSVEHADSLAFAANAGVNIGWERRSRTYLENALDIYLETVGETGSKTARATFDLGKYHATWDRHERAIEYFHNAIDVWSMEKQPNLIEIGTVRSFLVNSYTEIGEIDKATEQQSNARQ